MDKLILDAIEEAVQGAVEANNAFVVDWRVRRERNNLVIDVFADTDDGITADGCADLSRAIFKAIDNLKWDIRPYRIEVSSPGVYRPLKLFRQYKKNVGRTLKVRFTVDGEKKIVVGKLIAVNERAISLQLENQIQQDIAFVELDEAVVQISF
jgi:ribosome maturation factor RimP